LFDLRNDMNGLKQIVHELSQGRAPVNSPLNINHQGAMPRPFAESITDTEEVQEESLSIDDHEKQLIMKALEKNDNNRKLAAQEVGISTRTLYRKLKEYDLILITSCLYFCGVSAVPASLQGRLFFHGNIHLARREIGVYCLH
jgi:DNA-binding protein Fis